MKEGLEQALRGEIEGWKSVAVQSNTLLFLCMNRFSNHMSPDLHDLILGTIERYNRALDEERYAP